MSNKNTGYVYLLTNHVMPGLVKIGMTEVNDLDLGDDGSPNGFTPATPEDEQRYSAAREAIRERNRNK